MTPRRPHVLGHAPRALLAAALGLAHAACGESSPPVVRSDPHGDPVAVAWRGEVGERYEARIEVRVVDEERTLDGAQRETTHRGVWSIVETTTAIDDAGRPTSADLVVRYASGGAADPEADAPTATGTIDRASREHPILRWRDETIGPLHRGAERLDAVGLAADAPWIPRNVVRVGEAWRLDEVEGPLDPPPVGWSAPASAPWRDGTFRVAAIEGRGEDAIVVVTAETTTRLLRDDVADDDRPPIHLTEDLEGTARIAARDGRPLSFEITVRKRTSQSGNAAVEHARVIGAIRRVAPTDGR